MSNPTAEQITAVYVSKEPDLQYTCPLLPHQLWGCGRCGAEAFSYEPRVGDECAVCGARVTGVRRGPPEPVYVPEHFS